MSVDWAYRWINFKSGIALYLIVILSIISNDNETKNLSHFSVINHNPPMFMMGFSSRSQCVKDMF